MSNRLADSAIETAKGPVHPAKLGVTLMHEHLFLGDTELETSYPYLFPAETERIERAERGLTDLKAAGVDTLVDVTVIGIGRNVALVKNIAERVDVNIVVATGAIYFGGLPFFLQLHGPGLASDTPDPLDRMFLTDITLGIAETGVKAGIIKVATAGEGIEPVEERILRAAARAHAETGVPITTHSNPASYGGHAQQQFLMNEGVAPDRIVIGHCGDSTDSEYLKNLMDKGSYIGMDRFGLDTALPQEARIETVVALCDEGYAERMVLSHDASYVAFGMAQDLYLRLHGPSMRHTLIPDTIVHQLRLRGVTEDQLRLMLVDNPARVLSPR